LQQNASHPNAAPGEPSHSGPSDNSNGGEGQNAQGSWRKQAAGSADSSQAGERRANGSPDFQQMLSRMPTVAISDLQKGDAVMLVATEGSATSAPTAITLISGVEPIMSAAPSGASAASILSPWNLGSSPGGEATGE
jgi:hypothetical protein